jgi:hypothetical protein
LVLPMRHPIPLAKELATLQNLSNGRLILARISQTATGIGCRYSTFESEINVLQPFDLQSKEDSPF